MEKQLCRPEAATPDAIATLAAPWITAKLDGVRSLLIIEPNGSAFGLGAAGRMRPAGRVPSASMPSPCPGRSVLDSELFDGVHHVFDVLCSLGEDVRHLPLPDRLARAPPLPPAARLKRYETDTARLPALLAEAADPATGADGLIIVDAAAPYWRPALKFKPVMTFDLECRRIGSGDRVQLFCRRGPSIVELWRCGCDEPAVRAALREPVPVVECAAEQDALGRLRWRAVRPRPDRERPNSHLTVRDNLEVVKRGFTASEWLPAALDACDARREAAVRASLLSAARLCARHAAASAARAPGWPCLEITARLPAGLQPPETPEGFFSIDAEAFLDEKRPNAKTPCAAAVFVGAPLPRPRADAVFKRLAKLRVPFVAVLCFDAGCTSQDRVGDDADPCEDATARDLVDSAARHGYRREEVADGRPPPLPLAREGWWPPRALSLLSSLRLSTLRLSDAGSVRSPARKRYRHDDDGRR